MLNLKTLAALPSPQAVFQFALQNPEGFDWVDREDEAGVRSYHLVVKNNDEATDKLDDIVKGQLVGPDNELYQAVSALFVAA